MAGSRKQNYLHGAAILTVSVAIIKVLGAIYKIPLGNILGDEGYAHFSVAYNIYNVFLVLSTAGLPVALSRLISAADALNRPMQVKRTFNVALATFFAFGAIGSLLMLMFPTELASMMDDVEASQSIWAIAPAVLLVCLMSAYRGYAQGHSNMKPTAVSQVIEVAVKVGVGLCLAWLLSSSGSSLPVQTAGAISGVTFGSLAALLYIYIYMRKIYGSDKLKPSTYADIPDSRRSIFIKLLKIGIPIAIGSSVLSLISLIDTKLVLNRLQEAAGFSYLDAKVLFGVYSKAMTLYNLPNAFITPLTISVVPAIAACIVKRQHDEAKNIAESSLRISTIITLPMAVGLAVLSYPLMSTIYPGSAEQGPVLLLIMGIASYFVCMALMTTAVLQSQGNERMPVVSMIAGGLVKIAVNWFLVGDPSIGIYGAPIGTLCCYLVMCVLNIIFINHRMRVPVNLPKIFVRPLLSSAVMGAAAWAIYELVYKFISPAITTGFWRFSAEWLSLAIPMMCAIIVAVLVYVVLVIAIRAVTLEDMTLFPRGDKIAKILKIK